MRHASKLPPQFLKVHFSYSLRDIAFATYMNEKLEEATVILHEETPFGLPPPSRVYWSIPC